MHDIGAVVWVILVLIGVISSMRKNARDARARRAAPPQLQRVPPPPPPAPKPTSTGVHAQAFEPPPPVPAPPPAPAPPALAEPAIPPAQGQEVRANQIRGMFQGSAGTLVRAIVAAEVLGPPKSLQEQTIWSPRHSEPSI